MADPDTVRAAEFLAAHAVLLLGVGVASALAGLAAVIAAIRVAARFRGPLLRTAGEIADRVRAIESVRALVGRSRVLLPSGYLAVHLLLGFIAAGAIAVFAALAGETSVGEDVYEFDVAFARALQRQTTPQWAEAFAAVSALGTRRMLAIGTIVVAAALFLRGQPLIAVAWSAAQGGGGLLNQLLKTAFERARPEGADSLLAMTSWSFPSGHAMGTFIFCGVGCYLLLRDNRSWTVAVVLVTLSLTWCVVMAFSRLYLGVHFASDVVAGFLAGAAWVATCLSALEVVRRRTGGARHV